MRHPRIIHYINQLNQTGWNEEYTAKPASECLKHLMKNYVELEDEAIPKIMPKDYNEPWMNRQLMKLWKKKEPSWKRLQVRNSRNRWRSYRKDRDKLKLHVRRAKRIHEGKRARNARVNKTLFSDT